MVGNHVQTVHRGGFFSFFSGGVITAIVVNLLERKLEKRNSVQCDKIITVQCLSSQIDCPAAEWKPNALNFSHFLDHLSKTRAEPELDYTTPPTPWLMRLMVPGKNIVKRISCQPSLLP